MFERKEPLEAQVEQWRAYLRRRQAISPADVEELEDHLRGQVAALTEAGLTLDEAFLVAVKRMGALDAISSEFAREHAERLWKQLVVAPVAPGGGERSGTQGNDRRFRAGAPRGDGRQAAGIGRSVPRKR